MLKFAIVEDEDSDASKLTECIRRYCKSHDISYDIERFVSVVDFLKNYRPVYDIVFFDIKKSGTAEVLRFRLLHKSRR